jgi:fermentation-respiration switch protein FrsA (DUF1100 family)
MYVMQDRLLFPAPAEAAPMPLVEGMKQAAIGTPDGETLDGWYIAPAPGMPLIVVYHGSVGRGARHAELGARFKAKGFGYLSATFRGYAPSSGEPSQSGLLDDGLAIFDWAKKQCQCDIVVIGNSLGSGVGVHTARERAAKALILTSPYSSVADVAAGRYPLLPVRQLIKHSFPSTEWIRSVTEPILILHGARDNVVPVQYGKRLHEAAPKGARLAEYPDLGHELMWTLDIPAITEAFLADLPRP